MNELLIQQVLEIEKQAQTIHEEACQNAEQLQRDAEQQVQTLADLALDRARGEAKRLIKEAHTIDRQERIHKESKNRVLKMEQRAAQHFDHAVEYVLEQLVNRE